MVSKTSAKKKSTKSAKKAKRSTSQKKSAAAVDDSDDEIIEEEITEEAPVEAATSGVNSVAGQKAYQLTIDLSKTLFAKIKSQAEDEGLSPEEYAQELLAEGSVVRAWEIIERKIQMRGGAGQQQQQQQSQGNNRNNNRRGNDRSRRGGNMSASRYNNIMDDKAAFLEYVRNQERRSR